MIKLDLGPNKLIVILICYNSQCKHHSMQVNGDGELACNLKQVELDNMGHCLFQEPHDVDIKRARIEAFEKVYSKDKLK